MLGKLLRGIGAACGERGERYGRHLYARARWGNDLPALASRFRSDKWGGHWYAQHYQTHFSPLRGNDEPSNMLDAR
jgi:hypothetical protein